MNLKKVTLISLSEFEDQELLKVKRERQAGEYCWTCTPSLPLYILKKHSNLEMIAYLDSDLYFYSSPEPIYEEFRNKSIMIIPHRFSPEKQYLKEKAGKYNVGMLIFKNNKNGLDCLKWWRKKCLEWCFEYYDKGRLGDQLYLNDWPKRFFGVHVLRHKGADVALWNLSQYEIKKINNQIFIDDEPLIFYHFNSLKIYANSKSRLRTLIYNISLNKQKLIYNPYLKELEKAMVKVKTINPNFNYGLGPKVWPLKSVMLNNDNLIKLHTILWKIPIYRKFCKCIRILIYGEKSKN